MDDALKVLKHPLRARVLLEFAERSSPGEVARRVGEKIPTVAYQVRELLRLGCIAPDGERFLGGVVEHFYVATVRVTLEVGPEAIVLTVVPAGVAEWAAEDAGGRGTGGTP